MSSDPGLCHNYFSLISWGETRGHIEVSGAAFDFDKWNEKFLNVTASIDVISFLYTYGLRTTNKFELPGGWQHEKNLLTW